MARDRRDKMTFDIVDLIDATPTAVASYDESRVRTSSLRAKVARAVAETLRDAGQDREAIAAAMGEWLEEEVSKNMLDNYASQGCEQHTIPFIRLLALVHVTEDLRPLTLATEPFGYAVVDQASLEWIEIGKLAARRSQIKQISKDNDDEFDARLKRALRGVSR